MCYNIVQIVCFTDKRYDIGMTTSLERAKVMAIQAWLDTDWVCEVVVEDGIGGPVVFRATDVTCKERLGIDWRAEGF
jgi:hypothetical protein